MIRTLYILSFFITTLSLCAQKGQRADNLKNLVSSLSDVYQDAQLLMDSLNTKTDVKSGLWEDFLHDKNISKTLNKRNNSNTDITSGIPDLGLKWVTEANSNFRKDISNSEEDVFSRLRLSSGIDWLIWGESSFIGKKQERRWLRKKIERDQWISNIRNQNIDLGNKLDMLQNIFNAHRLVLLKSYKSLLHKEYRHKNEMYKQGLINNITLLEAQHEIESIQHSIDLVNDYLFENQISGLESKYRDLPSGYTDLPEFNQLENQIRSNAKSRLYQLNREVSQTEKNKVSDFNVRLKLRYNYLEYKNHGGQTYPSIALTVSVPLNFNRGNKLHQYELDEQAISYEQECESLLQELKNRHRHFYSLKKELIDLENDLEYLKALLNAEENKSKSQMEFTPVIYIDLCKKLYLKQNNILEKRQELCEEFILFHLKSGVISWEDEFVKEPLSLSTTTNQKNGVNEISTYLWGHFFKGKTNGDLLDILSKSRITIVFFSPADSDSAKVADFIKGCHSLGIKVYRLISENSYASINDGVQKLQDKLKTTTDQGFSGIHLNIEPHTFDDYKKNPEKYTERMNNLFKVTKRWCNYHSMAMSVSIPMHIPLETAFVLRQEKIDAYIMAYGNSDQLKLLERTSKLRGVLGNNTAWVFKISDFESITDLKKGQAMLLGHNIRKFAYYDCSLLYKNSK